MLYGLNADGTYVQIEVNGEVTEVLPLNEDITKTIETEYGANTLVISNGKAEVADADCPDKICVHHSAISKSGESIICLPHKLVISVTSYNNNNEVDAVIV